MQVPHDLGDTNEAQLRDVEEELHRGLKPRQVRRKQIHDEIPLKWVLFQISMMALGGAIGIGLVIVMETALKQGRQ
jgi:amino acid permease